MVEGRDTWEWYPGLYKEKTKAAGGVLTAKQAPHRPGTAPRLVCARNDVILILSQATQRRPIMWFPTLSALRRPRSEHRPARGKPVRPRLSFEVLEDRTVPANFTAGSVSELIAAMDAANLTAEADTITLVAGKTFTLTAVNNTAHGPTGLPVDRGGREPDHPRQQRHHRAEHGHGDAGVPPVRRGRRRVADPHEPHPGRRRGGVVAGVVRGRDPQPRAR